MSAGLSLGLSSSNWWNRGRPGWLCLILSIDRIAAATYLAGLHLFSRRHFTEFVRKRCAGIEAQSMMQMTESLQRLFG
jgi:hypothetical protein